MTISILGWIIPFKNIFDLQNDKDIQGGISKAIRHYPQNLNGSEDHRDKTSSAPQ